ncbi:hypothetical protein EXIGLDRAFT_399971 [Exidia glandulosa HHB12029]|uniref:Uncharacterized protein n=1 Tax=Exidia glandulosa HHB12029 TaxID=1314781 RepID=A0A165KTK3_EXIGL|nr:hypothetical protein EXIGLDRAFT_399971 [Exidia glandulosa HHB12029]
MPLTLGDVLATTLSPNQSRRNRGRSSISLSDFSSESASVDETRQGTHRSIRPGGVVVASISIEEEMLNVVSDLEALCGGEDTLATPGLDLSTFRKRRPALVAEVDGPTATLIPTATFHGNSLDTLDDLTLFLISPFGRRARDEDALRGRPALDTIPTWSSRDCRKCYALAWPVTRNLDELERIQRCVMKDPMEPFVVWMENRRVELLTMDDDVRGALLGSFLRSLPLSPSPSSYAPQTYPFVPVAMMSQTSYSYSTDEYALTSQAASSTSSFRLNPGAREFKPKGLASNNTDTQLSPNIYHVETRRILGESAHGQLLESWPEVGSVKQGEGKENVAPD